MTQSRTTTVTKRRLILWVLLSAVGVAAVAGYGADVVKRRRAFPEGLIQANGRIEGDLVTIASKVAGRIKVLRAREGDEVTAGEVAIELEDQQGRARVDQARNAVAVLEHQIDSATATEKQAQRDAERARVLASSGAGATQSREQSDTALAVARHTLEAVRGQLAQARAALAEAQSVEADLTIRAPISGTVVTRATDIGEVVAPGAPLLDVVDMDRLFLKVYVREADIGRLHRDLPAQVYTDAFPGRAFPATVRYIASRAEFTPKEVQTPDERVKLVYAVKLYLDENPEHALTPGVPADAVIRWQQDVAWVPPKW